MTAPRAAPGPNIVVEVSGGVQIVTISRPQVRNAINHATAVDIAAVNGPAIAGGFEIVLACDLIVAADDAVFGLPEVKRGLVAAAGGLLRLHRRIPYHVAMEWALSGDHVPARRAYEVSLVNRLVPRADVLAEALALATAIAANSPLALRATKRTIVESVDWAAGEAFARQREISEPVRASEDAKEGARAFTEKRPPVWRGR